ncbi:hypothetical protein PILCRDRAFT_622146 [Piloderma croceum F 1598]|uniref:protein-serine/threonine phosphatase n=1 Tax=Piloderma croceum (strain F 1598) TaxID=765440 RepID=A0A0C3EXP1_PILCF|nr:hypothetical protein PILCRDRAFT_622146 [Piloderma croceum F 1598]
MGQTLSSPVVDKCTESGSNTKFLYSVSAMHGWRIKMEDAHAAVLSLDGADEQSNAFFAVYDGHGGDTIAKFASKNVHKRLVTEEAYSEKRYEEALKRAFLGTDEDLRANPAYAKDSSGCTAVAALVTNDNKIYVANAGDSRSVISVKGEVKELSSDHKPWDKTEKARIYSAGGYIEHGRVNDNLALSRGLGDFTFKRNTSLTPEKQIITADPDVSVRDITEEDEFLVIACDGIWDCLSSQQVVDFVRLKISEGLSDGTDNMTFLVVAILGGRTKEEWRSWITDRVKGKYGYETPTAPPQLYSEIRLRNFKARQEMQKERAAKEAMEREAARVEKQAPETLKSNVQGSNEGMEREAARVERQAPETLKSNVQGSNEGMDRARTPTILDSDDSAGDLTPKVSAINIDQ